MISLKQMSNDKFQMNVNFKQMPNDNINKMSNDKGKTSLKWLTVAMPLLETRERETKERDREEIWSYLDNLVTDKQTNRQTDKRTYRAIP